MACVIRVSGAKTSLEEFFERSRFKDAVIAPSNLRPWKGANIEVSTASVGDLARQVRDAIGFLTTHQAQLKKLRRLRGVKTIVLDFALKRDDALASQTAHLPARLIALASNVGMGVDVSYYSADGKS